MLLTAGVVILERLTVKGIVKEKPKVEEDIPSEVFRNGVMQKKNIKNNDSVNKEDDLLFYGSDYELFQRDTENYLDPSDPIFIPGPGNSYPPDSSSGEINPDYEQGIHINEPDVDYELNIYEGDMIAPASDNL